MVAGPGTGGEIGGPFGPIARISRSGPVTGTPEATC